ncbi:MAG: dUTP diphosphatase [Rickettsiales bacterium]|jgi:dUTP pyrophosphatase|nr:dUTP diphosphatase [Rickettsiales bacterium]
MKLNIVFESDRIRDAYLNGEKKFAWGAGNSGIDMRCAEDGVVINPGETKIISSGVRLQITGDDDMVEWLIRPRSGMSSKGILCHYGTIDHSYTGIGGVCLTNLSGAPVHIEFGDRIAQIVVQKIEKPQIEFVSELMETDRGGKGFGSSGMK